MILMIAAYFKDYISWLNVLHYTSVRCIGALLTSLMFSLLFGDLFIAYSKALFQAKARPFTPENHRKKDNIPTLGGFFILVIVIITMLLWCNTAKHDVWIFIATLTGFGLVGLLDDLSKIKYKRGLLAGTKFSMQIFVALCIVLIWLWAKQPSTEIYLPFLKNVHPELGIFFSIWAVFLLVGVSNAVNLTDGLDGLAIGSLISNFAVFSIIAYLAGHATFAQYLHIPFAGTSEIAVIGATLIGASLGFLWFNAHPAQIFMGDVGSLSLGAALALMGLMSKQEILLAISGGLFVFETLSVIFQLMSWKIRKKKLFKMAPIHHHFELIGWHEPKITIRFNIISVVLCLLALITIKMR